MKLKIFLVAFISIVLIAITCQKLFVDYAKKQMLSTLHEKVYLVSDLFSHFVQMDSTQNIKITEDFTQDENFLSAFDAVGWHESTAKQEDTPEITAEKQEVRKKIYNNIQVELNTINKVYDKSDILFLTDRTGKIIVKNLDGAFDGVNLSTTVLIRTVLKGQASVDILKIKGTNYIVTAVPFKNKSGKIIGSYCSGDAINSNMIKRYSIQMGLSSQLDSELTPIFFAMIEKNKLLGSNLPPEHHSALRQAIPQYAADIQKAISEKHPYPLTFSLENDSLYAVISTSKQLTGNPNIALVTLSSSDKIIDSLDSKMQTFLLIAMLISVIALIFSFLIDESVQKPITRFTEGMLEIINGNTRFRFNNDVNGLEEMLNQNANMMISVLLNENKTDKES